MKRLFFVIAAMMAALIVLPASASPGADFIETDGATTVREGGAGDSYSLALTEEPHAAVHVQIADPTGQVIVQPTTVTFTQNDWSTPKPVRVAAIDDQVAETSPHGAPLTHTASSGDPAYDGLRMPTLSVQITDNDDTRGPSTQFGTANGQIFFQLPPLTTNAVLGQSTDDFSGVDTLTVTYTPITGTATEEVATLFCTNDRRTCSWRANVPPMPSRYLVRARARDAAGNLETPGPTIYIYVV